MLEPRDTAAAFTTRSRRSATTAGRGLAAWLSPAALALFLAAGVAVPAEPAHAQALTGVEAGEGPVDIEADELEVFDQEQRAVFRGNVRVLRGETTMTATELTVFYTARESADDTEGEEASAGAGGQDIERIEAIGPVTISTPEQSATGANGTYDVTTETVTLTGDVVLTQGENVLRGPKLTVNLVTGQARLGEGRVRAIFSGGAAPGQ